MFDNLRGRARAYLIMIATVALVHPKLLAAKPWESKKLNSSTSGFASVVKAVVGAVIALVIFAALIDTVLGSLNTAATNATLVANKQWAGTLSLLYIVGLMAVIVGIAIAAFFVMDALKE